MKAGRIETLFNRCFAIDCHTVLRGGAEEPLYLPADGRIPACIYYREDFVASALHEIAHWCIAGRSRRERVDYGYWYAPDGRSRGQQLAFERVEARPQALEWVFAQCSGIRFCLSLDNLAGGIVPEDRQRFALAVSAEAEKMRSQGLPPRAGVFAEALRRDCRSAPPIQGLVFSADALLSLTA